MSTEDKVIATSVSLVAVATIAGLAYSATPLIMSDVERCAARNAEELSAQLQTQIDNKASMNYDYPAQRIIVDTTEDMIYITGKDEVPPACFEVHTEEDEILLVWEIRRW